MAKKRKKAAVDDVVGNYDPDEFEDDEVDTQLGQGNPHMNDDSEKSQAERDLSEQEKVLKRQREADKEQREAASEEYEKKMAEAAEQEAEAREGEAPEEPPPECPQFEGYGEFIVPKDVNIRHQDQARGSRVALTWEDYQDLRKNGIYCEPVPQPAEPVEGTPV